MVNSTTLTLASLGVTVIWYLPGRDPLAKSAVNCSPEKEALNLLAISENHMLALRFLLVVLSSMSIVTDLPAEVVITLLGPNLVF